MHNSLHKQLHVFWQLIRRELHVLKPRLGSKFIDASINVVIQILVFGSLLPIMGMQIAMIGPTFIGSIIQLSFAIGYGLALRLIFDLENTQCINYYLTLPIHRGFIFGVYITNFIIEISITTIPLFLLGIIALGKNFMFIEPKLWLFPLVYLCSLMFMASLFLAFSFTYSFRWFFDNLWPRRLNPLFLLSSIFFPWSKVYAISKFLGILLLCNPFTYIAEGMRSTLIGGAEFLHPLVCISLLILFTCGSFALFSCGVTKRLDPV